MAIESERRGILRSARRWRCVTYLLLFLAIVPLGIGCYGKFPLTRGVYNFNADITPDKFGRSIVMWVFIIVPVYGVAAIGDVLIFNLAQFWTGKTVTLGSAEGSDGVRMTFVPSSEGREAVLTISQNGVVLGQEQVIRVSPTRCEMRSLSGRLDGTVVQNPDGSLTVSDRSGRRLAVMTADDIARLDDRAIR